MQEKVQYTEGIPEHLRNEAVSLYDEAFGQKFSVAIPCASKRRNLLREALCLSYGFSATYKGKLVGLAGYHSASGSLTTGISTNVLFKHLGYWGAVRAIAIFALYERTLCRDELLMDGIAVSKTMRSKGIGARLLTHIKDFATKHRYKHVRLDVIDTNPRAKSMYEKNGFITVSTEHFGFLRGVLGFGSSSTMLWEVPEPSG